MNKRNYQKELEAIIMKITSESRAPRLLLHSCCAPCSSYVLEYLSQYFAITVLYYNPNIFPWEEYEKRAEEQRRLIEVLPAVHPIHLVVGEYEPECFYQQARGLEQVREGGERCFRCYRLRLEAAARLAREGGYDYFTTTLTISPLKNADKLNEIGEELSSLYAESPPHLRSAESAVIHLPSDFKKKGGYQRSVELSKQYELYRQDFCGCVYSMR